MSQNTLTVVLHLHPGIDGPSWVQALLDPHVGNALMGALASYVIAQPQPPQSTPWHTGTPPRDARRVWLRLKTADGGRRVTVGHQVCGVWKESGDWPISEPIDGWSPFVVPCFG